MRSLSLLAIAGWLSIGLTASTTSKPTSPRLVKRSQPIFQDFNDDDEQDVKFKIQLQSAWSNSITLMANQFDVGFDNPIFSHYFGPNDKEAVKKVFDAMFQGNPNEGSFLLSSIIIDNEDFKILCVANANALCYSWRQLSRGVNNALRVHCCMKERTSKVPELSGAEAITCDALGNSVSYKMFSLSAALLHEYLHFDLIGGDNLPYVVTLPLPQATLIVDILQLTTTKQGSRRLTLTYRRHRRRPLPFRTTSRTRKTSKKIPIGYGPYWSRAIQQLVPDLSTRNADSSMWLALENHWIKTCTDKTGFAGPRGPDDQKVPDFCGGNNGNQGTQNCVFQ